MVDPSSPQEWAPLRFHSSQRPDISDDIVERCREVYELQADDSARFTSAANDLLRRLDGPAGVVTAMTCDAGFFELFRNWVASCDRSGIECRSGTIVFPTDRVTFERAESLGFVAYYDDESVLLSQMTHSGGYGDARWTEYMYHQNWVIDRMLGLGVDLLFQDVDLVWRRDPRPALIDRARSGVDIQVMYDGPNDRFQPLYANSGFMYFANSAPVRALWAEVYAHHEMIGYYRSQQEPLNVVLAAYAHRGLEVHVLDETRFANGHLYCDGRIAPPDPWVVHHSWTRSLPHKLERFEANGHWFLDQPGEPR